MDRPRVGGFSTLFVDLGYFSISAPGVDRKVGIHYSIRRNVSAKVFEPLRKLHSLVAKSYYRKPMLRYLSISVAYAGHTPCTQPHAIQSRYASTKNTRSYAQNYCHFVVARKQAYAFFVANKRTLFPCHAKTRAYFV